MARRAGTGLRLAALEDKSPDSQATAELRALYGRLTNAPTGKRPSTDNLQAQRQTDPLHMRMRLACC